MQPVDHYAKARRIEGSMSKLSAAEDYETLIENCMLAGTHYLNAIAHSAGLTSPAEDLLHSDKPDLTEAIPLSLTPSFKAMKYIEDLRPGLVRGIQQPKPGDIDRCVASFELVKKQCMNALAIEDGAPA